VCKREAFEVVWRDDSVVGVDFGVSLVVCAMWERWDWWVRL